MRWFALFLPQFHEVTENNEWWGEGFTEWTHVKAAKPLYKGHRQPIVPLNDNYYNLMDKQTVQWQTSLMKEYGVDGLVYYHYYFRGQKLLEKPAENLLQWTDIDQPFFFCWANHSWYKAVNGVKNLLREQTYGTEADWEEHFQYLLPFFKDTRYEKKHNKPVFMIYDCSFAEKHEMVAYFDRRCREEGFAGINIIETCSNASKPSDFDAFRANMSEYSKNIYLREPAVAYNILNKWQQHSPMRIVRKVLRTLSYKGVISWVMRYSGNAIYKIMLKNKYGQENTCHGVFFSWDNTPRHGVRGYVITPPSKKIFMRYADKVKNDDYVFINAWNEWAEGMILEPTTHDEYKYLSWIREWNANNKNACKERK